MKKKSKIFEKLKILLSISLCVLLLGSNFVFADSINIVPSTLYTKLDITSNGLEVYKTNSYSTYYSFSDSSGYCFSTGSGNSGHLFFISYSDQSLYKCFTDTDNPQNPISLTYDNENNIYYYDNALNFTNNTVLVTSFNSYQDGINFILNNYPDNPPVSGNFDLQVGNITFIDLGSSGTSYDLTLKSYFNKLSGTLSGGWEYDNRRYGFSNSLPDTTFSVDGSSGSGFLWTKTDPKNILGRSHYGLSNISGTSSGRYLWIVNPLYNENYYNDSLSGDSINGRINISGLPVGCTFYTYPLVQSATSISLSSDVATISGGTGTVSETGGNTSTVSIDDPNSSYTQPIGGDNSAPEEVTLQEGVNQLFQTLKDFTEKVINLLSAPADFIQQLINAGQGFTNAISQMFTWLPSPVQDVLIAALVVMIVVGFLKLLF